MLYQYCNKCLKHTEYRVYTNDCKVCLNNKA